MGNPSIYPKRSDGLKYVLLGVLGGLLLTPLWIVRYPPLVDYPNHLARSFVLTHLNDPGFRFSEFYAADWGLYPYVPGDVLTLALQHLVGIDLAGRIVLSLCVLSLSLAAWFFLRRANPENGYLALWVMLIIFNPCFLMGFVSSELSVALCLLTVGVWLNYLDTPRFSKWCLLLVLTTSLYLTHLMGFGMAGLIVTAYGLLAGRAFREMLHSWLLFVPGVAMYMYSKLSLMGGSGPTLGGVPSFAYRSWDFRWKLAGLVFPIRGYSKSLDIFTLLVMGGCLLAVLWKNRSLRWNYRWLGVAAVVFALYWIIPGQSGDGGYLDVRFSELLFVILLASIRLGSRKRLVIATALSLFALHIVDLSYHFVQEDTRLRELATSFSAIPVSARVMPLVRHDEDNVPYAQRGEVHLWAYGIIDKGWLSPALFHMSGVQPIRLRNGIYCVKEGCTPLVSREPEWNRVSRDYDYVWIYDLPEYHSSLAAIGSCVFSDGKLTVFRINKTSDAGSTGVPVAEVPRGTALAPGASTPRLP